MSLVLTRPIFLVLDFLVNLVAEEELIFEVSSFFAALSMEEQRDL